MNINISYQEVPRFTPGDAAAMTYLEDEGFINADEFPQIVDAPNHEQYQWPPVPELNPNQRSLVGYAEEELA